ncbi:hypothetical protein V6O07_02055 [Arthrospira platensis SPKY2]
MSQQNKPIEIDEDNLAFSTIRLFFISIRKQPIGTIIIFAGFIWFTRFLFSLIWFSIISSIPSPGVNDIFNPVQMGWFIGDTSKNVFKNVTTGVDSQLTYKVIETSGYNLNNLPEQLKRNEQRRQTVYRQISDINASQQR